MMKIAPLVLVVLTCLAAHAQLVVSGNENKIDLASGTALVVPNAVPDSILILDFSKFPPSVRHLEGIRNSVIGPPSSIAITPDRTLALIASSVRPDPNDAVKYVPDTMIHVLDLTVDPPHVIQEIEGDRQPSGMSISADGKFALVANRASGTISMLAINGKEVVVKQRITICKPEDNVADIAISPDGTFAVASVCDGGYLAYLRIENGVLSTTDRKFSVCGKPYRCVITPDGALALTGGSGQGFPDVDALTVIDLTQTPPRTVDYVPMGSNPESIEISPDGKLVAATLMAGSNLAPDAPGRSDTGQLVLLARRDKTFEKVQELPTGAIPEGVAFTADGRYLVVQCHPARELWIFEVKDERARDTGVRIQVPGRPSSLRAATTR
jgi:DNA-binding beta-propeller fold protein YncE